MLIWQVVDVGLVDRCVGQAVARGELLVSIVSFGSAVIRLGQAVEREVLLWYVVAVGLAVMRHNLCPWNRLWSEE